MAETPEKLTTGEPLTIEELLEYLPTLKEVPAALLKMYALGAAVKRIFREGDIVCEEGDFGSTAFYIVQGHVDIYLKNPLAHVNTTPGGGLFSFMKRMKSMLVKDQPELTETAELGFIPIDASVDLPRTTPLAWLGPGELFGEMTCRTYQPRSATVRATEDCVMVEMLRVILDMLLGTRDVDPATKATTKVKAPTFKGTSFKKLMDDKYRERSLVAHLRSVPLFSTLDLAFFNFVKENAELVSCNKGEVICKQGEPADAFYLIRSGLVRVAQAMPGGEMVRTYLKRGEFFGEIGLLRDQARNATCSALDAADLVKIDRPLFQTMLEKFPVVRVTLEQIATVRVEADKERRLPVGLQLDEFLDQGLFEAQNLLLIDLDNCTRCDACVNACADAHDGVTRLIRDGLRYDHFLVATACRSCRDPLCMTQCPVGSIRRKESLEIIIEDWCIGCGKCAELCPYGNINMHSFDVMKEVEVKPAPAPKKDAAPVAKASGAPAAKPPEKTPAAAAPSKQGIPADESKAPESPVHAEVRAELAAASTIPVGTARAVDPTGAKKGEVPVREVAPDRTPSAAAVAPPPAEPALPSATTGASREKTVPAVATAGPVPAPAAPIPPTASPAPPSKAAAASAGKPADKPPAPPSKPAPATAPKKMQRKKMTISKATTCDLCTQLSVPSCVYACPHDAAKRVDPTQFLAGQIGARAPGIRRGFRWLTRRTDRTTH